MRARRKQMFDEIRLFPLRPFPRAHPNDTFATPSLPADFARIPLEHERSRVLASVPGTVQAAEAVLLAQVPQTARVSKTMVPAPDVAYAGTPAFETISPTTVARATNTDKDIFKVGDLYYMTVVVAGRVSALCAHPGEAPARNDAEIPRIRIARVMASKLATGRSCACGRSACNRSM